MKIKLIRCGICQFWTMRTKICPTCGAIHVQMSGKRKHYNRSGREMARGIPIAYHQIVNSKSVQE